MTVSTNHAILLKLTNYGERLCVEQGELTSYNSSIAYSTLFLPSSGTPSPDFLHVHPINPAQC
jgi:hypothetical protein